MEQGDLSNEVSPRLLFVFEGTIATLPSRTTESKERFYLRTKRWAKAVALWEISDRALALLWDVTWRYNFRFDVVTFRPAGFAKALAESLSGEVPAGRVFASSPNELAKRLAFWPDVRHVYHADQAHALTYGGRGVLMPGGLAAFTSLW